MGGQRRGYPTPALTSRHHDDPHRERGRWRHSDRLKEALHHCGRIGGRIDRAPERQRGLARQHQAETELPGQCVVPAVKPHRRLYRLAGIRLSFPIPIESIVGSCSGENNLAFGESLLHVFYARLRSFAFSQVKAGELCKALEFLESRVCDLRAHEAKCREPLEVDQLP